MSCTLEDLGTETSADLRCIGKGACGTVWAANHDEIAFKREDGSPSRSPINDSDMHQRVVEAFKTLIHFPDQEAVTLQVPRYDRYTKSTDCEWWTANLQRFPQDNIPCNVIQSQRIPPFGETVRRLLVSQFCPQKGTQNIWNNEGNRDSLIRPYLGRRRTQNPDHKSKFKGFSLRNLPLHFDQMEQFNMNEAQIHQYARLMAKALDIMHWIGEVDANDVEFVLAPQGPNEAANEADTSLQLGKHDIWVLDYDLCRRMTMDLEGINRAALSFWRNDPYFPRPERDDSCSNLSPLRDLFRA